MGIECSIYDPPSSFLPTVPPCDADKRVDPDKKNEIIKTLHFPSQSATSSLGNYGSPPDESPDSPVKTSPVSERIKALEALVAKKKEPDFRNDCYSHYKDRHTDKRSSIEVQKAAFEKTEKNTTTAQKKGSSSDKDSPDSPFEILGDCKPLKELEDTEMWMREHLPPMQKFRASDDIRQQPYVSENVSQQLEKKHPIPDTQSSIAGVPDAFMDDPVKTDDEDATVPQNPYGEEECDFDLSFLPTAYMCSQNDNYDAVLSVSPPAGFESKLPTSSPEHKAKTKFIPDPDPPEAVEVDSSGESDDTVIEDVAPLCAVATFNSTEVKTDVDSASTTSIVSKDEKEVSLAKSERKLMQVPTINVIETDDPNYSDEEIELEMKDEEEEDITISKDQDVQMSESISESGDKKIDQQPLDNQFGEEYSPPSSPVESDTDLSPKHEGQKPFQDAAAKGQQDEPHPAPDFMVQSKDSFLQRKLVEDFSDHDDEWGEQAMDEVKSNGATSNAPSISRNEKPRTQAMENPIEAHKPKSGFVRDDIYDRESFDYDYDAPPSPDGDDDSEPDVALDHSYTNPFLVSKEQNALKIPTKNNDDTDQDVLTQRYPQDPYSVFYTEPVTTSEPDVDNGARNLNLDNNYNTIKGQETVTESLGTKQEPHNLDPAINSEPADSFVEFMRECLKSRQNEDTHQAEGCSSSIILQDVQSSKTVVADLDQENLTISARKDLGNSQEEEMDPSLHSVKLYQVEPSMSSVQHNTQHTQPASSQCVPAHDSTYAREVEAIDEWVAEAYHLAEHVLTAVLTHLSGNLFFPSLLSIDLFYCSCMLRNWL